MAVAHELLGSSRSIALVPGTRRIQTLDAFRGLALAMMAVAHCAYLCRINVVSERYLDGPVFHWTGWGEWLTAIICNPCAVMLWLSCGMSVALAERARRGDHLSEWAICRFLWTRSAILFAINLFVIVPLWTARGQKIVYTFDILSSLAVSMALLAVVRRIAPTLIFVGSILFLAIVPAILHAFPLDPTRPGAFWYAAALVFSLKTHPSVWYPALAWFPVMALGYACVRLLDVRELERPRFWWISGGILIALWGLLRGSGAYANLMADLPATGIVRILTMCKQPPSLAFLSWNLGISLLMFALIIHAARFFRPKGMDALVVFGRTPFFFFVGHFAVYQLLTRAARHVPGPTDLTRALVLGFLGLALLYPLCVAFGAYRSRHPKSWLRFL